MYRPKHKNPWKYPLICVNLSHYGHLNINATKSVLYIDEGYRYINICAKLQVYMISGFLFCVYKPNAMDIGVVKAVVEAEEVVEG